MSRVYLIAIALALASPLAAQQSVTLLPGTYVVPKVKPDTVVKHDTVRPPPIVIHDTVPWACPVGWTCKAPQADSTGGFSGRPFGPYNAPAKAGFTGGFVGLTASSIDSELQADRGKRRVIVTLTGGDHSNYITSGKFDPRKWGAVMASYNTPAIRNTLAQAMLDGTVIGNSVMDEPQTEASGKSWGGVMTKARVDSLCAASKAVFPFPAGAVHDHDVFDTGHVYRVCDFIVSQYRYSKGSLAAFRDAGLAFAQRNGMQVAFSINILDGGKVVSGCPSYGTSANESGRTCPMTPAEIRESGYLLGTAGCALAAWRYEKPYNDRPDIAAAFKDVSDSLARLPAKRCSR